MALRRAKRVDDAAPRELAELISEGRVVLLGSVRQELLGNHLRSFPDLELESGVYEEAAAAFNRCRERGIQGSNTDFLICATAMRRKLAIYAADGDW